MKYLDYDGLRAYDALIKQYIADNIPEPVQLDGYTIKIVNSLPAATASEYEKNLIYCYNSDLYYIVYDGTSTYTMTKIGSIAETTAGAYEVQLTDFTIVNVTSDGTYQVNFSQQFVAVLQKFAQPLYFSAALMTALNGGVANPSAYFIPNVNSSTNGYYDYITAFEMDDTVPFSYTALSIQDVSSDNSSYNYTISIDFRLFSTGSTVSGTNDGTNWNSITIGNDTYAIPSGGSSSGGESGGSDSAFKMIEVVPNTVNTGQNYAKLRFIYLENEYNELLQSTGLTEQELITAFNGGTGLEQVGYLNSIFDSKYLYACACGYDNNSWHNDYHPVVSKSVSADIENFTYATYMIHTDFVVNAYVIRYGVSQPTNATVSVTSIGGGSCASSDGSYYELITNDIAFYDNNGNQVTSDVVSNFRIALSEGQFEALKTKVNPMLTQMGMQPLTDIDSLATLLNTAFTETSASASNVACNLFLLANGYCDFSIDMSSVGIPMFLNVIIGLVFVPNITVISIASNVGDISGTTFNLYTNDGNTDIPMGISATWTLNKYGSSSGGGGTASQGTKYYEFTLQTNVYESSDDYNIIKASITEEDLTEILNTVNDMMSSNLQTVNDVISLYNTLKSDDLSQNINVYSMLCSLIAFLCSKSIQHGKATYRLQHDNDGFEDIMPINMTMLGIGGAAVGTGSVGVIEGWFIDAGGHMVKSPFVDNFEDTDWSADYTKMSFDANSTLTVEEVYDGGGSGSGSGSSGNFEPKKLVFTNVTADNWVSDNTYSSYGYKCVISCTGITASSIVDVIFGLEEATSGNYAPICETGSGTVTIYGKVNDTITIPTIKEV